MSRQVPRTTAGIGTLHCLVLDGVYRCSADGVPTFVEAGAPTAHELRVLLQTIITRLMKMFTRRGVLIEEMGQAYLAAPDGLQCLPSTPWAALRGRALLADAEADVSEAAPLAQRQGRPTSAGR